MADRLIFFETSDEFAHPIGFVEQVPVFGLGGNQLFVLEPFEHKLQGAEDGVLGGVVELD